MRRTVLRPEAEFELVEAIRWYETQSKGLAESFLAAVDAALEKIQRRPFAYQKMQGDVRRILLQRFPYGIFYLATESENVILACFHFRRDPAQWQKRT